MCIIEKKQKLLSKIFKQHLVFQVHNWSRPRCFRDHEKGVTNKWHLCHVYRHNVLVVWNWSTRDSSGHRIESFDWGRRSIQWTEYLVCIQELPIYNHYMHIDVFLIDRLLEVIELSVGEVCNHRPSLVAKQETVPWLWHHLD